MMLRRYNLQLIFVVLATSCLSRAEGFSVSRRDAMISAAVNTAGNVILVSSSSWSLLPTAATAAASSVITEEEKKRIQTGYSQIQYLLDNFEQETTVCKEVGNCKRDADAVRKALGLRSINDPLFQIEKVFDKAKNMDIDPDKLDDFFDAVEDWSSAANMSNSMAFISQFGEYNPGGGQDAVLKYLLESKKQVFLARDSLKKIMDALDIPAV